MPEIVFKPTDEERTFILDWATTVHKKREKRDQKWRDVGAKRITNEYIGKLAEYASGRFVGGTIDWRFFNKADFGGDLDEFTHVKACDATYRGDPAYDSWLVEQFDLIKLAKDPKNKIILAYVQKGAKEDSVTIIGEITPAEIDPLLWKEPKRYDLKKRKFALYYEDIKAHIKPIQKRYEKLTGLHGENATTSTTEIDTIPIVDEAILSFEERREVAATLLPKAEEIVSHERTAVRKEAGSKSRRSST